MLIRSGLIQNVDRIEAAAFGKHWREVHGPLAARLPNLRGYVQNHIVARGKSGGIPIHRIDGISQLWFDDVGAMTVGMNSPENDACIADISGFLARVTLAIQDPGAWAGPIPGPAVVPAKVLAVYVGDGPVADVEREAANAFAEQGPFPARYRVNPVQRGTFIVDPSIARSEAPILAVVEALLPDSDARERFLEAGLLGAAVPNASAEVLAVTPYVFIPPPADSAH
ncbi:MAG: EthD family reductase [Bauldia sp.]